MYVDPSDTTLNTKTFTFTVRNSSIVCRLSICYSYINKTFNTPYTGLGPSNTAGNIRSNDALRNCVNFFHTETHLPGMYIDLPFLIWKRHTQYLYSSHKVHVTAVFKVINFITNLDQEPTLML